MDPPSSTGRALSYDFSNTSDDITRLFVDVCESLQLRPRLHRNPKGSGEFG
jgi:hypothetical protein